MIYLIGDNHFGHKNIIKYCNRPFSGVDEMNMEMTNRWNNIVKPTDTVIHLGDFSFQKLDIAKFVCSKLNGKKILVRGNHDKKPDVMMDIGFDLVVESMMLHIPELGKCFLSHYPIESDTALEEILKETGCEFQIHGHSHNGRPLFDGMRFNVSCENTDYTPANGKWLREAEFLYNIALPD